MNWLTADHWPERHWPGFTAEFHTGEGRPLGAGGHLMAGNRRKTGKPTRKPAALSLGGPDR